MLLHCSTNLTALFDEELVDAIHNNETQKVTWYLQYNADPNQTIKDQSLLHHAVQKGNSAIAQELLLYEADINAKSSTTDKTALDIAIENVDIAIVRLLLLYKPVSMPIYKQDNRLAQYIEILKSRAQSCSQDTAKENRFAQYNDDEQKKALIWDIINNSKSASKLERTTALLYILQEPEQFSLISTQNHIYTQH